MTTAQRIKRAKAYADWRQVYMEEITKHRTVAIPVSKASRTMTNAGQKVWASKT